MSSAPKTNRNSQKNAKNNEQIADKSIEATKVTNNLSNNTPNTIDHAPNKQTTQATPPLNLTVVREESISSEDGISKNNKSIRKQKQKRSKQKGSKSRQQKPQIKNKQIPKKEEEIVYDQYNVLKISGLLDAYEHFLKLLCKNGLPTGKIYDYAAQEILKYEKKKINKELKMRAELDIQKILKKSDKGSASPQKSRSVSPYYQH